MSWCRNNGCDSSLPHHSSLFTAWIVERLVDCLAAIYCNVPLDDTDSLGRTPLHIAVLHGSMEAIPFLANGSTAALIQDIDHRCPLHWACTRPIGYNSFQNGASDAVTPITCKLICLTRRVVMDMCDTDRILLEAYPEVTLLRDSDQRTPLEIVQYYKTDLSIVRIFHHVEQANRQERKSWCDWNQSLNGDTTSLTTTESDSILPHGIPSKISYHSRHVRYRPSDPSIDAYAIDKGTIGRLQIHQIGTTRQHIPVSRSQSAAHCPCAIGNSAPHRCVRH